MSEVKLKQQCAAWNAEHPVGTNVTVRLDGGETRDTVTVSPAEVLSGHSAVIWLEGISGCYLLDRVKPRLNATALTDVLAEIPDGYKLDHLCEHWRIQDGKAVSADGLWTCKLVTGRNGTFDKVTAIGESAERAIRNAIAMIAAKEPKP